MSTWFPDFLAEQFDARVLLRRLDREALMKVVVVELRNGRRMILLERSYRDGLHYLPDPTPEELEIAESGLAWTLWNSERSSYLAGLEDPRIGELERRRREDSERCPADPEELDR